jgi:methylated-DNA-[protein]-cysteine S-methyltransferase
MPEDPHASLAEALLDSPLGRVRIAASERGVREILFTSQKKMGSKGTPAARRHAARAVKQLREYFSGKRREFDLPLDLKGTENQKRVWRALREISFGETLSYGELARRLGVPRAARAVGAACGANPICVVIPCHRVIGADGGLHGYGGGLPMKRALLELEGVPITEQMRKRGRVSGLRWSPKAGPDSASRRSAEAKRRGRAVAEKQLKLWNP